MKKPQPSYDKQGEEKHGEARTQRPYDRRAEEDAALIEVSFEPTNEGDLWIKNGVFYGREAALQKASRKLREDSRANMLEETRLVKDRD